MKRLGLLAACLLLLLANVFLFLRVSLNRSGDPDATVILTGREVEISDQPHPAANLAQERPIRVKISWKHRDPASWFNDFPLSWFDTDKLQSIGFDCRVPANSPEAYQHYRRMRPRQTFVVLEYHGSAYEAWRRQTERKIRDLEEKKKRGELSKKEQDLLDDYRQSLINQSRLFCIDVGNDPKELRQRYSDRSRFIITPAAVRLAYESLQNLRSKKSAGEEVRGEISYLLVDHLTLSDQQCARLEEMIRRLQVSADKRGWRWGAPQHVRFTICYGRNYEPWVADFSRLEETK